MDREESLQWIRSEGWTGKRPGLHRIRALLSHLGNPQDTLHFVHVAGTNGKGSACAMLASVFQCAGYRTGLYTSPEREIFEDRICVDGRPIPEKDLCSLTERLRDAAEHCAEETGERPTEYDLIPALAFLYFAERKCEIVILEVGMGGEYDSTNIIAAPEAALIMNIGLDHTAVLGRTREEIAAAKAGIIKRGTCVISYPSGKSVIDILRSRASEIGAAFYEADPEILQLTERTSGAQRFLWKEKLYELSLAGETQLKNASVVLTAIDVLRGREWDISDQAVRRGLASVCWENRFEILCRNPLLILDGAHNVQCAEALTENLRLYFPGKKFVFVMGILRDKEAEKMLKALKPVIGRLICVTPDSPRALPAEELENTAAELHIPTERHTLGFGNEINYPETGKSEYAGTVVCGSLSVTAELRKLLMTAIRGERT